MLIEFVGPPGVGKSTVATAAADHLGVPCFSGQGFHDVDGRELTPKEIQRDRREAVARYPLLFLDALRTFRGPRGRRFRFAFNICRRNNFARKVRNGVTESGPVHGLCQAGGLFETDMSRLARYLVRADLYVRLSADPDVVSARIAGREDDASLQQAHLARVAVYERMLDSVLADSPVVPVDASGTPDEVIALVVGALDAYLARR